MAANAEYKRLFLRGIKWDSEDKGILLFDCLKAASRARLSETSAGLALVGTTGNGHSVTFSLPGSGQGLNPTSAAELCGEMLRRYDQAKAFLVTAGTAEPTDDEIFSTMLTLLAPVKTVTGDFSSLRLCA